MIKTGQCLADKETEIEPSLNLFKVSVQLDRIDQCNNKINKNGFRVFSRKYENKVLAMTKCLVWCVTVKTSSCGFC